MNARLRPTSSRNSDTNGSRIRLRPALLLAIWTVPGVLQSTPVWIAAALDGHPLPWWRIGAANMPGWYLWAALTPLIFRLAQRFPLRRGVPFRHLALYVAGWLGCSSTHAVVTATAARALGVSERSMPFVALVGRVALSWVPSTTLIYCATIGVAHWMLASERERQHERDQAELSVQLATAQLSALRSQLHPHFLFNALNTISILIRERDTTVAVRLVAQLGDVLRQVLRTSTMHETALAQEVALVRAYLGLEEARFGDRLTVHWLVPDGLLDAAVPVLVLQPLVENAVRHGIAQIEDVGVVEIGAGLDADVLMLWVADNGPGPDHNVEDAASGVGLLNTRARLTQLYPGRGSLNLVPGATGGARAEVRLPFRRWR